MSFVGKGSSPWPHSVYKESAHLATAGEGASFRHSKGKGSHLACQEERLTPAGRLTI